jgi:hypothetical protein
MLRLVLQRVASFSAFTVLGFALLMLDPDSPSLMSEAQACDQGVYESCLMNCGFACFSNQLQDCRPDMGCDCYNYCHPLCLQAAGC